MQPNLETGVTLEKTRLDRIPKTTAAAEAVEIHIDIRNTKHTRGHTKTDN